ncbi:MAG TPA: copper homeostasis membrane protein CopD [Roseiarcus sp.]|nr:copper homeostasis membrane protein CopD [Roseiarcus sp.]
MNEALILVRFAHFVSTMALFGASVFLAALAPARLREALTPSVGRLISTAALIAAASAILWLLAEGGEMGGNWTDAIDPQVLSSVLNETGFGRIWRGHLALALAICVIALWRPRQPQALIALLGAILLGSLGFIDHAAMREGAVGLAERINQALHLLAGGFWLGSLPPLLLCLGRYHDEGLAPDAAAALSRFSGIGHLAVGLVIATGLVNVFVILGRWPSDFSSPYQTCLAIKIALVAVMAVLALYNRYLLTPALESAPERILPRLRRNAIAELWLGGGVLALVSAFATFAPE